MKTSILAAGALFATSTLAAPGTAARWANHAVRRAARRSGFRLPAEEDGVVATANGTKNVEYSSNWAGAVLSSTGFTSVVGTIIVPTPKSTGKTASASAWVGIDGDTCGTAILQTGLDFSITSSGSVSYDAWYEWYPDYAYDFSGFPVSAGDEVKITVVYRLLQEGRRSNAAEPKHGQDGDAQLQQPGQPAVRVRRRVDRRGLRVGGRARDFCQLRLCHLHRRLGRQERLHRRRHRRHHHRHQAGQLRPHRLQHLGQQHRHLRLRLISPIYPSRRETLAARPRAVVVLVVSEYVVNISWIPSLLIHL
ncbi:peptidase A4 family-domain-containing protein [Xylaria telfairii]|nr:peptidase A4 family-domain-containing protein [Xylaria telfairii]